MNLRNRLIWIAVLTVAFASVQLVASRRKAQRELVEFVKDKLQPLADACAAGTLGVLTLQVRLAPEGKLDSRVESLDLAANSQLQEPQLVECVRQQSKALTLKHPLPSPEQIEVSLTIEAPPR